MLARHAAGFDPRDLAGAGLRARRRRRRCSPRARAEVGRVQVAPEVLGYAVDVCRATRQSPSLSLGVSPRGATALLATSRAWAWLSGRGYVTPDDVKALAHPTLRHRVQLRPEAELEGVSTESVLDTVLASVARPPLTRGRHLARGRRWPRSALAGGARSCPRAGTVLLWTLLVVVVCVVDVALAASPRQVAVAPRGAGVGPARRAGDVDARR